MVGRRAVQRLVKLDPIAFRSLPGLLERTPPLICVLLLRCCYLYFSHDDGSEAAAVMNSVNGQLAVGLVFVGTTALICYADVLVDARVVLVVFVLVVHLLTPELGNFVASRMGRKDTILTDLWLAYDGFAVLDPIFAVVGTTLPDSLGS